MVALLRPVLQLSSSEECFSNGSLRLEAVSAALPWDISWQFFARLLADSHLLHFAMSQTPEIPTDVYRQILAAFSIFHPSRLGTEDDISVAVGVLEDSLDNQSIGPIILSSLQPEHPYVFEFIVSSVSNDSVALISRFVLERTPPDPDIFQTTLGYKTLSRLSHSLPHLYPSGQRPEHLDEYRREIDLVPTLLEDLSKLLREGLLDDVEIGGRANKRNTQRGRTPRFKVTSDVHAEINDRLFQALGREAPRSRDSVKELVQSVMEKQRSILQFFTTLIRSHETAKLVRSAYFRENVLQGNLSIQDEQADIATSSTMEPSPLSLATAAEPIRADLYFESAAGYGKWRILCSGLCLKDLAQEGAQPGPVLRRLEELSSGCFSETNQRLLTKDSPIEIYRARLPGSVRLVYHIDVIHEFGKDYETQVLKILGICSMDKLNRTDWDKLGKFQARKGPDYVAKCRARDCYHGFYFNPVTFDTTVTAAGSVFADAESPACEKGDVEEVDEIHRLLDLEQYAILSQNVISDILEGHDYTHVFQVSHEEKKVVESTRSTFVLGRSGTGKTTVIVFKVFGIERAWQTQGCVGPRPRQLFITKSRLLAEKVERDYVNLLYSLSAGPNAPLYVRERIQSWNSRRKKEIFNPDDTEGRRDDLPGSFSELRDSHFPLFLTMDALSSLLGIDMKSMSSSSSSSKSRNPYAQKKREWNGRTDLVTYDVFKRAYWPHFPRSLTRGLEPSLVFSEILGTIKGSEKSLDNRNRALDREAYESLRNTHSLDYTLFEAYETLKRNRGERDLADRTHTLLDKIKNNGLNGELVDFVYVDEVQDMLLIDTRLIISLCRNPDGLLWAGDTAQTISIGSTFTFKQLGASVYRYQRSIRALRGTPRHPEGFQLLKNYRSHGGIVKCANAIVELLQRFPSAIDPLRPEAGVVGKELPKFFFGEDFPRGREFFLSTSGRLSKLGHNQCIIVRDEDARKSFKEDIGRVGVTLTLFNSKGLEYDDVILYNFFEASVSENLWRYLTDEDQHKLRDLKHAPLIHELKCLYVAMTRAKHRLWIVDYSNECKPIMRYLLDRGLVIEPSTSRNPVESFADESTSGEWSDEGKRLMNHREFEEAIMAFDNAGDAYMTAVATAYHSQEVARDVPESERKRRRDAFVSAATLFEHCAEIAKSAKEESAHYASAARCYAEIKYHQDAVRAFKLATLYTEAASYCFDNNLLDSAVSIIKIHEAEVDIVTTESIKEVARLSYLESQNLEEAADLFKDDEEQMMEFVVEHELGATRAVLLERQGKYGEAVKQYLDEGQESEALDLALEHIGDVTQNVDAFNAIVEKFLWRYLSFGCRGWTECANIPFAKIRALLKGIPVTNLNDRDRMMLFIFKLVLLEVRSKNTLEILSNHILRCETLKRDEDKALRLLAFDYLFDDMSSAVDVSSQTGIVSSLELFYEYSLLITHAALDKAPWDSPWLSTLFQFEKDGEGIRIRPGTFIQSGAYPSQSEEHVEHPAVSLSREELTSNLNRLLSKRLLSRIMDKDRISSRLRSFDPCIQLVIYGTCRSDHTASHQLDEAWFNRRARFHLQHIMILDNLLTSDLTIDFPIRVKNQRRLLYNLGNALNPLLHHSGSISTLNEDLIPEAADGFSTVKRWALDVLYTLNPSRVELQDAFLTNLYTAFTLGRLRQDGRTVDDHLRRIPSASSRRQRHPRLIAYDLSRHPVYTLHDFVAFMDGSGDLVQGIRFFRYLVCKRIPIDLAVLCNIMERLFGLAIMTAKYGRSLHGVLLPWTWVLALWKDFMTFKDRALAPLWVLAQSTESLLKDVYSGEYLRPTRNVSNPPDHNNRVLYWSKDLPPKYLQDLCVARICRCLCLLGENFPDLRSGAIRTMGSFMTAPRPESTAFHRGYMTSRSWRNLAEVLYQSTPPQFDHLIRLHLRIIPTSSPHPPSVQLVVFEFMHTIPDVLRSRFMNRQVHHRREMDVIASSHATSGASDMIGQLSAGDGTDDLNDIPRGDKRAEELVEYSAQDAVNADGREEPDKTKQALVIQRAFQRAARRHALREMEEKSNGALTIGRNRLFKACKASSNSVHVKYRKIYLGPVPHLLLCLEWIATRAQDLKNTIKTRRGETTVTCQELSELILQHKETSGILDEARDLQKRMAHPVVNLDCDWDGERHLKPLRSVVTKTRDLLERLSDPESPSDEFELAWNGIMPKRLQARN